MSVCGSFFALGPGADLFLDACSYMGYKHRQLF
jgi:hypothetical protein